MNFHHKVTGMDLHTGGEPGGVIAGARRGCGWKDDLRAHRRNALRSDVRAGSHVHQAARIMSPR